MTYSIRNLFCDVNNRLLCKQIIDYLGRAGARSDQKISRQLPQASARLRQRKRRTV